AILQAVVLRIGGNHYAVPTLMVEQVQKVKQDALASLRAAGSIEWQGTRYPFHHLRRLVGLPPAAAPNRRFSPILPVRSRPHRTAIQVDDLVGGQEIVIKNIGPQLARVPGITGAAVLGTGETVLILNPVLLAQRAEEISKSGVTQPVPAADAAPAVPASTPAA